MYCGLQYYYHEGIIKFDKINNYVKSVYNNIIDYKIITSSLLIIRPCMGEGFFPPECFDINFHSKVRPPYRTLLYICISTPIIIGLVIIIL